MDHTRLSTIALRATQRFRQETGSFGEVYGRGVLSGRSFGRADGASFPCIGSGSQVQRKPSQPFREAQEHRDHQLVRNNAW